MTDASKRKLGSKVNSYIQKFAAAPAQKSAEWYELKKKTIGGSEIATLLGLNPFKKPIALIAEKIGIEEAKFNGNIACRWGTMFENVTKQYTEVVLSMEEAIRETGSIPGVIERQRYSPDGLGIVKLLNGDDVFEYFIVLFEFKAPYSSMPDGKVPKHYMPQIQTGLLTIPLADTAIFVNNCYRKCKLSDVGFELTYDKVFHSKDVNKKKKSQIVNSVLATGIICLYHTKEDYDKFVEFIGYGDDASDDDDDFDLDAYINNADEKTLSDTKPWEDPKYSSSELDMEILMSSCDNPIDFGGASMYQMERMFELFEEKRIKAVYYPMVTNTKAINDLPFVQLHQKEKQVEALPNARRIVTKQYNQFLSDCDDNEWYPIGYLPWKLVKSDIIGADRDPEWHKIIETPIKEALATIDEILSAENPQEAFYEKYPPHDVKLDDDYAQMLEDMSTMIVGDKNN